MPTVDLPGSRSMRIDSACSARHRSSASPVILLYLTPASGLNSNVVTTGPGMNLHDRAFDRELAALFLEQPRALHQLALVDLPLGLRRIEQRHRRQREAAHPALDRRARRRRRSRRAAATASRRARARGARRGDGGRLGGLTAAGRQVAPRSRARPRPPRRGRFALLPRGARRRNGRCAASAGRGRRRCFFVCLAITSRRSASRRRSSRHARNDAKPRLDRPMPP